MNPSGRISIEKYFERREDRLRREQLENQSVYSLYISLGKGGLEAARFPTSVELASKIGANVINLTLLNEDMERMYGFPGEMNDGILCPIGEKTLHITYERKLPAVESYLLDYEDGMGMPTMETLEGIRSVEDYVGTGHFRI